MRPNWRLEVRILTECTHPNWRHTSEFSRRRGHEKPLEVMEASRGAKTVSGASEGPGGGEACSVIIRYNTI